MPPEFTTAEIPDAPRYWAELERHLMEAAAMQLKPAGAPLEFDSRVYDRLAPREYQEPRFPATTAAAMVVIVLCAALLIQWLPGHSPQADIAEPGTEAGYPLSALEPSPVELIPIDRTWDRPARRAGPTLSAVDRLTTDLRNHGYDVHVEYRIVTDPALDGEILAVRHAFDTSSSTLFQEEAESPVIVIVAEVPPGSRTF